MVKTPEKMKFMGYQNLQVEKNNLESISNLEQMQ
jgi:hypothetical protein